jgi:LacI family transcriptional regulator
LKAHTIPYDPNLIIGGRYDRQVARQAMTDFLKRNPPPFDAVFASDDDLAMSITGALEDAGMNVPDDVAVVGFDDQRFASLFIPPLTTVRAPTREVGEMAGRQLMRMLQGQPVDQATVLPTSVVIRQSCGCLST